MYHVDASVHSLKGFSIFFLEKKSKKGENIIKENSAVRQEHYK